jgi:hypothetical protein
MKDKLICLHKYYLNASFAHNAFKFAITGKEKSEESDLVDVLPLMSIWYGCLYVVVEGWIELKLSHLEISPILEDEVFVRNLKQFRHDTFHYQSSYFPTRSMKTFNESASAAKITDLHFKIGRAILELIKTQTT